MDLFSPPLLEAKSLKDLQDTITVELEKKLAKSINSAVKEAVKTVVTNYIMEIEQNPA